MVTYVTCIAAALRLRREGSGPPRRRRSHGHRPTGTSTTRRPSAKAGTCEKASGRRAPLADRTNSGQCDTGGKHSFGGACPTCLDAACRRSGSNHLGLRMPGLRLRNRRGLCERSRDQGKTVCTFLQLASACASVEPLDTTRTFLCPERLQFENGEARHSLSVERPLPACLATYGRMHLPFRPGTGRH